MHLHVHFKRCLNATMCLGEKGTIYLSDKLFLFTVPWHLRTLKLDCIAEEQPTNINKQIGTYTPQLYKSKDGQGLKNGPRHFYPDQPTKTSLWLLPYPSHNGGGEEVQSVWLLKADLLLWLSLRARRQEQLTMWSETRVEPGEQTAIW